MRLTWSNVIVITENMFDISQEQIAGYLKIDPATISRIKKGITGKPQSFSPGDIFRKIYDPTNEESPASGSESALLSILKDVILEEGFKDIMQDLWDKQYENGDYKTFVMAMLKRTRSNRKIVKIKSISDVFESFAERFPDAAAQQMRDRRWIRKK